MKKQIVLALVALLVIVSSSYAQVARNASPVTITNNEVRTNFSNIGVTGLDRQGNPGYIAMAPVLTQSDAPQTEYYLWIDETGDLCMASWTVIQRYASFPTGAWTGTFGCTKVGTQS